MLTCNTATLIFFIQAISTRFRALLHWFLKFTRSTALFLRTACCMTAAWSPCDLVMHMVTPGYRRFLHTHLPAIIGIPSILFSNNIIAELNLNEPTCDTANATGPNAGPWGTSVSKATTLLMKHRIWCKERSDLFSSNANGVCLCVQSKLHQSDFGNNLIITLK